MNHDIRVTLPPDNEGMVGRECPQCKQYFKIRPGTGLSDISTHTCPYCEFNADTGDFLTAQQLEYLESIAVRQVLGPVLRDLERSFRALESSTRHSLISIKVQTNGFDLPLQYYSERDIETRIVCDNCGLVYDIYGVFATCPDCARLATMSMFKNSIEVARKRLGILSNIPVQENETRQALMADTLAAAVSTFDGLGKRLQQEYPVFVPEKPRSLFQNLDALSETLMKKASIDLRSLVGTEEYAKIYYLFQVRHLWSHNFGEADEDFIRKTGADKSLIRTKIVPSAAEIQELLALLETLGSNLRQELGNRS